MYTHRKSKQLLFNTLFKDFLQWRVQGGGEEAKGKGEGLKMEIMFILRLRKFDDH